MSRPEGYYKDRYNKHKKKISAQRKTRAQIPENRAKNLKRMADWRVINKEKVRIHGKVYYADNKDVWRDQQLKRKYGITLEDYTLMHTSQNGQCKICYGPPSRGKSLSVDHCHTTGKVRGLLCDNCNKALGGFNDKIDVMLRAIEHLKSSVFVPE